MQARNPADPRSPRGFQTETMGVGLTVDLATYGIGKRRPTDPSR